MFIGAHGTDVSVGALLLSGETLLHVKNFAGHRWDSNPGPCMDIATVAPPKRLSLRSHSLSYREHNSCLFALT